MTLAHFVYIPGVLLLGFVLGFVLGGRAAEAARAERGQRKRPRAQRVEHDTGV